MHSKDSLSREVKGRVDELKVKEKKGDNDEILLKINFHMSYNIILLWNKYWHDMIAV